MSNTSSYEYPCNLISQLGFKIPRLTSDKQNGLERAISELPIHERQIIVMRFKENKSLSEIAILHRSDKESVRNVLNTAIKRLQKSPSKEYILYEVNGCSSALQRKLANTKKE